MSVSGGLFLLEEFFSPARFNRKVPSHLTGAEIAALSPIYPNMEVTCTATGSGFTVDVKYRRNSSNTAWLSDSGGIHKHDADSDAAGGLASDIFVANLAKALWFPEGVAPTAGMFKQETSGGATITDPVTALPFNVRLFCGTANGAFANISRAGVGVNWSQPIKFMARLFVSHGTFMTARFGVACENANEASEGSIRKMGFEACDSADVAKNYDVFSSNGTTRTSVTQTFAVAQAAARGYRLDYTPATNITPWYHNGTSWTAMTPKTTGVPAGSESNNVRVVSAGIKQNNSFSNPNERIMQLSAITIAGTASTAVWG